MVTHERFDKDFGGVIIEVPAKMAHAAYALLVGNTHVTLTDGHKKDHGHLTLGGRDWDGGWKEKSGYQPVSLSQGKSINVPKQRSCIFPVGGKGSKKELQELQELLQAHPELDCLWEHVCSNHIRGTLAKEGDIIELAQFHTLYGIYQVRTPNAEHRTPNTEH